MALLTEDGVRALAGFKGHEGPVTSCYLDVDGSRFPRPQEVEHALGTLLRRARSRGEVPPSVEADLRHMEHHVHGGLDRANVRGLAMFSCSAAGFWEVYELPMGVTSQLVINHSPAVTQLETLVEEHRPLGLLLADRSRARAVVVALGEVVADESVEAEAPSVVPDGRASRSKGQAPGAAQVHRHEKRAADLAFEVFRRHGAERIVLGVPGDLAHELEEALHPYLREQLGGTVAVGPSSSLEQIRRAALDAEQRLERLAEAQLVDRVRADWAKTSSTASSTMSSTRSMSSPQTGQRRPMRARCPHGQRQPGAS